MFSARLKRRQLIRNMVVLLYSRYLFCQQMCPGAAVLKRYRPLRALCWETFQIPRMPNPVSSCKDRFMGWKRGTSRQYQFALVCPTDKWPGCWSNKSRQPAANGHRNGLYLHFK
uniref:Putative secreted protein n=1 Tax=Anopheles marajoara TaxID=58244 RepID=A0A2M4C7Z5_9DIPT